MTVNLLNLLSGHKRENMYGGAKKKCQTEKCRYFCSWRSYLIPWTTSPQDPIVSYLALVAWLSRFCIIMLYILQAVGSSPVFVKHISTYCIITFIQYSTSRRNGNPVNGNHLEICLLRGGGGGGGDFLAC